MPPPVDNIPEPVRGRISKLPFNLLWESLVEKTKQPDLYLPVTNVTWRDNDEPAGSIYREMTLPGKDGAPDVVMKEVITHDEKTKVVEFRSVNDPDFIVVNRYVEDGDEGGHIEYFVKDSQEKMLGWMKGGREAVAPAIEKHYQYAEKRLEDKA
jgi:hypothetical protein